MTPRDMKRLEGVHPDLCRVVMRCAEDGARFTVLEGLRSVERQRELFRKGASRTMKSRHITGHAVDLAPDPLDWNNWSAFAALATAMKVAAAVENVPLEWGGDWASFKDGPHYQLPAATYPDPA